MCRFPYWLVAVVAFAAVLVATACGGDSDDSDNTDSPDPGRQIGGEMILATTTSTEDSGLLDVLVPLFREETGVNVKVIAVGTGAALEMGAKGDADAVLVHAPASEQKYVESGDLVGGKLVMHNDYVVVGPADDPANIRGLPDLASVMAALAEAGGFVSRGDDSGTHKAELQLWEAAGINPDDVPNREETGQGMGATLNVANERRTYTLTDRGTFLALRNQLDLVVLFEGDRTLLNIYSVYVVNPEKHSGVKAEQAQAWVDFMVEPETQRIIGEFKKEEYGESLFTPDAGKSIEELGN